MFKIIVIVLFSISLNAQEKKEVVSQAEPEKTKEEKKFEDLDFSNLKQIIKDDKLEKPYRKKIQKIKKIKKARQVVQRKRTEYVPGEKDFWGIMSELWLIKNASLIKWDFEKPEYGIDLAFQKVLKNLGYLEKKVKVLVLNSSVVPHFALPSRKNEYILMISLPFMRSMDLTKLEISMLLLEDLMRADQGQFVAYFKSNSVNKMFGKPLNKFKGINKQVTQIIQGYTQFVFKKGFTFQQQFTVTKSMSTMIQDNLKYWNAYFTLNKKRQNLMRSNKLFKEYSKIYPSPEMQVNWLNPNAKI